jgi:hypothetical protein
VCYAIGHLHNAKLIQNDLTEPDFDLTEPNNDLTKPSNDQTKPNYDLTETHSLSLRKHVAYLEY